MIRAIVHTEFLAEKTIARVEGIAAEAVTAGAEAAKQTALAIGASRNMDAIEVVPAHTTGDGYAAGVSGKWYYRFQSYGTLGKAIKPKRPGTVRSHAQGTGITPNMMWQRARIAGRRAMLARVKGL